MERVLHLESSGFKAKRYSTEEHNLYCEMASNSLEVKRTFVIAHGACATGRYMKLISNQILNTINNTKVILLDLAFHGESTSELDVEGHTINDYTDFAEDFLQALKEDGQLEGKVNWVGWSMGGSIGLLLELRGNYINELVLVNSAPYWPGAEFIFTIPSFQQDDTAKDGFKEIVTNEVAALGLEVSDAISNRYGQITSTGKVIRADFNAIKPDLYDVREDLVDINSPTLIFSGTKDILATVEMQSLMHQKIPNSRLSLVDFTHATVLNPESVETLTKEIKDFFL